MIIALTGASGSLGKELIPFFEESGHTVLRISSNITSNGKDIFSFTELIENSINKPVDILIHLASHNSDMLQYQIAPEVKLTEQVLNALKGLNCKKLIFFSSAKVYGDNSYEFKTFNELSPLEPNCPYGEAKKRSERLILSSANELGINSIILRLPPVLNWSASSNFTKLMQFSRSNSCIPSFRSGDENKRSFLSINNLKTVMNCIMLNPDFIKGVQIYNLADNGVLSLNDLLASKNINNLIILPNILFWFFSKIPFFNSMLLKLYGNFAIDNSKLKADMDVTLLSTIESLPPSYK
jgi:UDP-glucose 4-epimerase